MHFAFSPCLRNVIGRLAWDLWPFVWFKGTDVHSPVCSPRLGLQGGFPDCIFFVFWLISQHARLCTLYSRFSRAVPSNEAEV